MVAELEVAGRVVELGQGRELEVVGPDPQVLARDMVVEIEHPRTGRTRVLGCPIKFTRGDGVTRRGAPVYGQDTHQVLTELGYTEDEIVALASLPFFFLLVAAVAIITVFPSIVMVLPQMAFPD